MKQRRRAALILDETQEFIQTIRPNVKKNDRETEKALNETVSYDRRANDSGNRK
jgi:hypothetical protein